MRSRQVAVAMNRPSDAPGDSTGIYPASARPCRDGPCGRARLALRLRPLPEAFPHPHEPIALADPCLDFAIEFIGRRDDQCVNEPTRDGFLDACEARRVESLREGNVHTIPSSPSLVIGSCRRTSLRTSDRSTRLVLSRPREPVADAVRVEDASRWGRKVTGGMGAAGGHMLGSFDRALAGGHLHLGLVPCGGGRSQAAAAAAPRGWLSNTGPAYLLSTRAGSPQGVRWPRPCPPGSTE